jgi:uncharacterized protein (TIGR02466 family)
MSPGRAANAARLRHALAANPDDRVSWHNLAAAEGDLGHAAQAEAIALRPAYVEAHRDLAQLLWMRTGHVEEALRALDSALRAAPREAGLHHVRSIVLEFADDLAASLAAANAGLARVPNDAALLRQAAHLRARTGDAKGALALAQRAAALAPKGLAERVGLCEALLGAARASEAQALAAALFAEHPWNQNVIALRATAWRLLGDPRYRELYDYATLVDSQQLDVPSGWSTRNDFLRDVAAELDSLHAYESHPLQQSVRGGSQLPLQAPELARAPIAALFQSIAAAVQRHMAKLGAGPDPLRARNTRRFGITGAWSVRLRSGGYHTDHVHPQGWISSACYIALPPEVAQGAQPASHAGWLRLGQPGVATSPALGPDHFVKPEPGLLVLFPAYMWHGVEPFASREARLSVAFDVVPG